MCNLYSVTTSQVAIREAARAMHDRTGNLPPLPGIFPDYGAPIVREGAAGREMVLARWGMPSPLFALKRKKTDAGVTNIRNVTSPHWGYGSRTSAERASFHPLALPSSFARPRAIVFGPGGL